MTENITPPLSRAISRRGLAALLCAAVTLMGLPLAAAWAQSPPAPTFYWPYGKVQVGGGNVTPAVQPVIAFVNGKACGSGSTLVATPADGTPASDVGKTVYIIDVLADGGALGERPGCGHAGDPVTLYFVRSGIAVQQPAFRQGGQRVDVDIVALMGYHLQAPMMAADGTN